jgi:ketosteroid isomerase-like protein
MDKLTPPPVAETETLREYYAAVNRNDIPSAVKAFDSEIEWTEAEGYPEPRTLSGCAAVQAHITKHPGNWTEGICEPERFIPAGDKIIVLAHVRVRLKENTEWIDGRIADVYTFRDGRAIQFHSFADSRQALEWAGVKASDAN